MMPRSLVTGAAGFLGSHLVDRLLREGHDVVGVDNLSTGRATNLYEARLQKRFRLVRADVTRGLRMRGALTHVWHFASLASPPDYFAHPIETLRVGAEGTHHALELARRTDAVFVLASTSEVYGDPEVSPQPETYWGRVNPVGLRSCYDESKRYAEALTMAHRRVHGTDTRIARIFNTYGPRMRLHDGRVVPNLIGQALRGEPLTIHGDGRQTRSFCYHSDLIEGLVRLARRGDGEPTNLGNPHEVTINAFARRIQRLAGARGPLIHTAPRADDPPRRRPDIRRARRMLGWSPRVPLEEGLQLTWDHFHSTIRPHPSRRSARGR